MQALALPSAEGREERPSRRPHDTSVRHTGSAGVILFSGRDSDLQWFGFFGRRRRVPGRPSA